MPTPNATTGNPPDSNAGTFVRFNTGAGAVARFVDLEIVWKSYEVEHASAVALHRYPGVAGQTIEGMGRESVTVSMESLWAGQSWRRDLDNFIFTVDSLGGKSGYLVLPDGRAFNASCTHATERHDGHGGCVMPLTFLEDSHDATQVMPVNDVASDAVTFAGSSDPAVADTAAYYDEYLAALNDPSRIASRQMLDLYRQLDAALYAAQQTCNLYSTEGTATERLLAMARWRVMRSFPFPDLL